MVICQGSVWQPNRGSFYCLIRPKLKEMLERPVLKNLKGDDKIDLTSLTKIALQKTTPYDECNFLERKTYFASL